MSSRHRADPGGTYQHLTILVSGAPGTGKTTIQRLAPGYFRGRLGETAAIGTDEIYQMVDPDWSQANEYWKEIGRDNCIMLAKNLFAHGVRVVLIAGNDLYSEEVVNRFVVELLPVSAVFHFTLDARPDVVAERVGQRSDAVAHPAEWLAGWLEHVRGHLGAWGQVIDTSGQTAEETLEMILQKVMRGEGKLTGPVG